ncbi:helix-turn-helix transcriptional regulator [Fictibacillus barbaricus]|nr:helix-turn-helix transcriptional regulator [Fictibacillus barbaricus]
MLAAKEYEWDSDEWNTCFPEPYTICYGTIRHKKDLEENNGFLYLSIKAEEVVESYYRLFDKGVMFSLYNADVVLVVPKSSENKSQLHDIKSSLESETGISLSFGFQIGDSMSKFQTCFNQAKEACDYHYFYKSTEIYPYKNKFQDYKENKKDFSLLLKEAVSKSDDSKMNFVQEEWISEWEKGTKSPELVKREAGELLSIRSQRKVDISLLVQKVDELANTETMLELKDVLTKTVVEWETEQYIAFDSLTNHQQIMEKAIHYIQHNYTSEITLQKIADYTFISKNYFSILFKKYMNQNFLDYVISLRIKKAKELLSTTSLKVYEVAHKSGFNDVKYFSKLFKKLIGSSPIEYREKELLNVD